MSMRRRIFLKGIASTLALTSVAAKTPKKKPITYDQNLISVLMGPAFDGSAEFSIVHCQTSQLQYAVYQGSSYLGSANYMTVTSEYNAFKVDKFLFQNLPVDQDLTLKIYSGAQQIDERYFISIPSDKPNLNIGLTSCLRAGFHDKTMWNSLESQKSDVILFLGDSVYVDFDLAGEVNQNTTPKELWIRYVESRMILQCYQWKRLVPIIAIWDDHDVGGDNVLSDYPFLATSQITFKTFFAQSLTENHMFSQGPGVACKFQLGNHLFMMLDGRSYRQLAKPGVIYSFFGKTQEEWIFHSIKNFNGTIWLCNGTQWFNQQGFGDSFRKNHKLNFNGFIEHLNQLDKRAVFLAGDMHFSEICTTPAVVKNKSIELTSSCLHSSNFVGLPTVNRNPLRIVATGHLNFLMCKIQETSNTLTLTTRCLGRNQKQYFSNRIDFDLTT